jgi:hypothetical protein
VRQADDEYQARSAGVKLNVPILIFEGSGGGAAQMLNKRVVVLNGIQDTLAADYEPGIAVADRIMGGLDERVGRSRSTTSASTSGGMLDREDRVGLRAQELLLSVVWVPPSPGPRR